MFHHAQYFVCFSVLIIMNIHLSKLITLLFVSIKFPPGLEAGGDEYSDDVTHYIMTNKVQSNSSRFKTSWSCLYNSLLL